MYAHPVYIPLQESIASMIGESLGLSTKVDFKVEDGSQSAIVNFRELCGQMTHCGVLQCESRSSFLSFYILERGGTEGRSSPRNELLKRERKVVRILWPIAGA